MPDDLDRRLDIEKLRYFRTDYDEGYLLDEFKRGIKGPLGNADALTSLLSIRSLEELRALSIPERLRRLRSTISPNPIKIVQPRQENDDFYIKKKESSFELTRYPNTGVKEGYYRYILYLIGKNTPDWYVYLATQRENENANVHDSSHSLFDKAMRESFRSSSVILREGVAHIDLAEFLETQSGGTSDRNRRAPGKNELSMRAMLDTHFQGYDVRLNTG